MWKVWLLCLTLLAAGPLCACEKVAKELVRGAVKAASPEVQAPKLGPVSEAEAADYTRRMLAAMDAGDAAAVEHAIDYEAIVQRALAGVHLPRMAVAQTAKGVATGARQTGLTAQLAGFTAAGTDVTLIANRVDREGRWVSFRTLPASGGFEHYELLLGKRSDGSVVAADAFFLSAGELMSTSMRRLLISSFASDKSFLERLKADDDLLIKHGDDIRKAREAQVSGDRERALALYEALPDALKNQKFLLLLRLQTAMTQPEDPRYAKIVATLIERFPRDPAAAVASIDHFMIRKEYDKAVAAVEAVERGTTPDPYFSVVKADLLTAAGKLDEARQAALAAIEREPSLLPAHFSLVTVLLRQKDHEATSAKLLQMQKDFTLTYELETTPAYADFVASPQYPAFKRALDASLPQP